MNKTIYTNEHKYIVQQLRKARIESGLDQEEVAKLLKKLNLIFQKLNQGNAELMLFN